MAERRWINISDEAFFEALEPDAVKITCTGDEAWASWGDHFAARTEPVWYIDSGGYPQMAERFPAIVDVFLERAARILKDDVIWPPVPVGKAKTLCRLAYKDGIPDYTVDPVPHSDHIISIRNFKPLVCLPRAWLISGRDEFADCCLRHLRAFYERRNDIPTFPGGWDPFWNILNSGLRLMKLLDMYACLRTYEGLQPAHHAAIMKLVLAMGRNIAELAESHRDYPGDNGINAGLCALGSAGVLFPELRESREWVRIGSEGVAHQILDQAILKDGAHIELCTQYQMAMIRDISIMARVMALNGIPSFYGEVEGSDKFKAMHDWIALLAAPDGFQPPYHSGVYATEWLGYLMIYEQLKPGSGFLPLINRFYESDYVPVAKGGAGDPIYLLTPDLVPEKGSSVDPGRLWPRGFNSRTSGTCICRSGATVDDAYLGTIYGKAHGGHGYPQQGSFVFYARGRWLVLHPGSPLDYSDPQYSTYFHTTFSHNTVIVDEMNQPYAAAPEPNNYNIASECLFWDSDDCRSILQIRHRGYQPLAGVTHTRTFVLMGSEALFIHDYLECDNDDPHDYHWALHSNEELVAAGDRTWRSDQMAVVFGSPLPLPRRTRRPCMLPLALQADMSEQQGETN
ncbi:MAG: heparinase II/III family protein, partial [Planctomycetia bacterium]|nr:heparinase II/III family protein [Planctomycetia bacterium]